MRILNRLAVLSALLLATAFFSCRSKPERIEGNTRARGNEDPLAARTDAARRGSVLRDQEGARELEDFPGTDIQLRSGLDNGATGSPTQPPSSGIYFNDGSDEDLRARPEGRAIAIEDLPPGIRDQFLGYRERSEAYLRNCRKMIELGGLARTRTLQEKAYEIAVCEERPRRQSERTGKAAGPDSTGPCPEIWSSSDRSRSFAEVSVGGGKSLDLVSLDVRVTVEGHRALTVVDHVFHNPHGRRLEGTFTYALPPGASICAYGMYVGTRPGRPVIDQTRGALPEVSQSVALSARERVFPETGKDWGKFREGRVVPRDKARQTFDTIVRRRTDPALLEKAAGNFFRGRVFPIEPDGTNRVILAYEETMPLREGRMAYRFPLPGVALESLRLTLSIPSGDEAGMIALNNARRLEGKGEVSFVMEFTGKGPGGEALFSFTPADPAVQVLSGRDRPDEDAFFHARIYPRACKDEHEAPTGSAVFLVDTSASENKGRFKASCRILRAILAADKSLERFRVIAFDSGARFLPRGVETWLPNTEESRKRALDSLESLVLEGGTEVSAALELLETLRGDLHAKEGITVFFLSDGDADMGEMNVEDLASRARSLPFPARFFCYLTALDSENLALMEELTSKGGGVFPCFSPEDLATVATAHRRPPLTLEKVEVSGSAEVAGLLVSGGFHDVPAGGSLQVCGRLEREGKAKVTLIGRRANKPVRLDFDLDLDCRSPLAARAYGEIAVRELERSGDPGLEDLTVAYCQRFGIGSQAASFLVLESDEEYKRFDLEEERSSAGMAEIDTATLARQEKPAQGGRDRWLRYIRKAPLRDDLREGLGKLIDEIPPQGWTARKTEKRDGLPDRAAIPEAYLEALSSAEPAVSAVVAEAERRRSGGSRSGALRALSSLLDLFPAEPGLPESVAYRLVEWDAVEEAIPLLLGALEERPFEPQPWLELARAFEAQEALGPAALCWEVACLGEWDGRFRSVRELIFEECAEFRARLERAVSGEGSERAWLKDLSRLPAERPNAALAVTATWNTDNTDVDLWVIEPSGEKCFYRNSKTKSRGSLSDDLTAGYGPERYSTPSLVPGEYRILLNFYSSNRNLLGGATTVRVKVVLHAGRPAEQVKSFTVVLEKDKDVVEATRILVDRSGEARFSSCGRPR